MSPTKTPGWRWARACLSAAVAAAVAAAPGLAEVQNPASPPAAESAPPASTPTPADSTPPASTPAEQAAPAAPDASRFTREELQKLLAPIALYPDPLLAQLLPASAYPLQIVEAARWLEKNKTAVKKKDFSGVDKKGWDPAVKALARFPDVIKKLNDDLTWTSDLGDAIVNQPQDVAAVIQELRAKADKAGTLKSTPQHTVKRVSSATPEGEKTDIVIMPTDPSTIYVPAYDPGVVYDATSVVTPLVTFGAGVALGALATGAYWNWRTGAMYPPTWAGYPGWRPPYPGWRPGAPINGGVNIGNDINIGAGDKPWRPGGDYRPGQGTKPGIGGPGRPGGIGGVGGPGGPGGVGGPGRPGGIGGPGGVERPANRPATGARPGAARPGGAKPATRPAARSGNAARPSRPSARPSRRPAARPGGNFHGGGRHHGGLRQAGFHGGGRGGYHGGGRRSDMRLKHDIVLLGRLNDGVGFYRFVYNGGRVVYVGVMAQEVRAVMPEAVTRGADGYLRVSYERLGAPFETYKQWVAAGSRLPDMRPERGRY